MLIFWGGGGGAYYQNFTVALSHSRPFLHSTSVHMNNRTRTKFGWTFSYICFSFVHPDLDSVPLFIGMWEGSIASVLFILSISLTVYTLAWLLRYRG